MVIDTNIVDFLRPRLFTNTSANIITYCPLLFAGSICECSWSAKKITSVTFDIIVSIGGGEARLTKYTKLRRRAGELVCAPVV